MLNFNRHYSHLHAASKNDLVLLGRHTYSVCPKKRKLEDLKIDPQYILYLNIGHANTFSLSYVSFFFVLVFIHVIQEKKKPSREGVSKKKCLLS